MKRAYHVAACSNPSDQDVSLPCGCVNHIGGEITWCPLHAQAEGIQEALLLLETATRRYIEGLDGNASYVTKMCVKARALLWAVEGK